MILVALFVVFFLGGPLAFRALTDAATGSGSTRRLAIGTVVCAGTGIGMRYGLAGVWGRDVVVTFSSIALVWFAWIGVLAFGARALRQLDPGTRMRRWTGMIGAAGTTVPWFGLASANMMNG